MAEYVAKRDRRRRPGVASIRINFPDVPGSLRRQRFCLSGSKSPNNLKSREVPPATL